MIDQSTLQDRMISRSRNLATPLARLQELAPRLMQILPDTVCGCADRLGATRDEIEDAVNFVEDNIANRGGCLVRRDRHLAAFDQHDGFYTNRRST